MKKIILLVLSLLLLLSSGVSSVSAQQMGYVDKNTFILDAGNDLGKITPKGTYYVPQIPYTDANAVKEQFIRNLNYPGDFYSSRNIDEKLLRNQNPYFDVQWNKPLMVKSLPGIKRVLSGYLFAYRKNGDIQWMDAKNFTPAFLSGYNAPQNQSIIIYPIRNKETNKITAFLQYPCGNLVCKDTRCTDLKKVPVCGDGIVNREVGEVCDPKDPKTRKGCSNSCKYEELHCKVYNTKGSTIDDKTRPSITIKKESNVDIKEVYVNRDKYTSLKEINSKPLESGRYEVNALAINKFSGKEFLCEGSPLIVKDKQYCGDGKVSGAEECDYAAPGAAGSCSKSCKFTDVSCSVIIKGRKIIEPTKLSSIIDLKKTDKTAIKSIELNGKNVTKSNPTLDKDGEYTVKVNIQDTYSKKEASCEGQFTYDTKEYCGDGIKNGYEQCDDGGTEDGDGCSRSCRLERPMCQIKKTTSKIEEGNEFKNYVKFNYTGKFETAVLDNDKVFNSVNELLDSKVPNNKCGSRSTLSYTISNPIDPSMTKTCKTNFSVKNKEYCGDGIVQRNEQCDPNDPVTGLFCENSCEFKTTNECHIMENTFEAGEYGTIVMETEYFVTPSKLSINGKNISGRDGIFKIKVNTPGSYKVTALLKNKLDRRNVKPSYCTFNLVITENQCKKTSSYSTPGSTGSSGGFFGFLG